MKRFMMLTLVALTVIAIAPASFARCFYCSVYQDCFMGAGSAAQCYSSGTACMTSGKCDGSTCTPMVDCKKVPFQNGSLTRPLAMDYQLAAVTISRPAASGRTAEIAGARTSGSLARN